jgi:hypothetical protein
MKFNNASIAIAAITFFFLSCGNQQSQPLAPAPAAPAAPAASEEKMETSANQEKVSAPSENKINANYSFILGNWKGTLRNKKFALEIESINGTEIKGFNIVDANRRPVSGTITPDDRGGAGECGGNQAVYKVILREPGDDKWDGFFTLYFSDCGDVDTETGEILGHSYSSHGNWEAYSGKLSGDVHLKK